MDLDLVHFLPLPVDWKSPHLYLLPALHLSAALVRQQVVVLQVFQTQWSLGSHAAMVVHWYLY